MKYWMILFLIYNFLYSANLFSLKKEFLCDKDTVYLQDITLEFIPAEYGDLPIILAPFKNKEREITSNVINQKL